MKIIRKKKVIQPNNESKGRGGIIFLIILGLLFGYGYISLKKEEAEWEAQMEQYRLENRRRTELSEFKAREEKHKKKEGNVQTHHHLLRPHLMMKEVMMHILVIMMRIVTITMKIIVMV